MLFCKIGMCIGANGGRLLAFIGFSRLCLITKLESKFIKFWLLIFLCFRKFSIKIYPLWPGVEIRP